MSSLLSLLEGAGFIRTGALFQKSSFARKDDFNAELLGLRDKGLVKLRSGDVGMEVALSAEANGAAPRAGITAPTQPAGSGPPPIGRSGPSHVPATIDGTGRAATFTLQRISGEQARDAVEQKEIRTMRRYMAAREAILLLCARMAQWIESEVLRREVGCPEDVFEVVVRELIESGRLERMDLHSNRVFAVRMPSAAAESSASHSPPAAPAPAKAVDASVSPPSTQQHVAPAEDTTMTRSARKSVPDHAAVVLGIIAKKGPMPITTALQLAGINSGSTQTKVTAHLFDQKAIERLEPGRLSHVRAVEKTPIPTASVPAKLGFNEERAERESAARNPAPAHQELFECAISNRDSLRIDAPGFTGSLSPEHTRELFNYLDRFLDKTGAGAGGAA